MNLWADIRERIIALILITSIEIAAAQLLPHVSRDDFYFVACGAFNLITLSVLAVIGGASITVDLAKLTFVQLCLQCLGWILYSLYLSPAFYNASIHAIVAATYIRLLIPPTGEDDGISDDSDGAFFHRHAVKRGGSRHEVHQC